MQTAKDAAAQQVKLIAPFVNSVRNVISTMIGIPTNIGTLSLTNSSTQKHDVSGIIGFSGGVTGSVVIGMPGDVAAKLVSAFAGTTFPPDSPDFADAVGELANMIAGGAKKNLGVVASISVPTVILGNGHQTPAINGIPRVVIPCQTELGNFDVAVNIKQTA